MSLDLEPARVEVSFVIVNFRVAAKVLAAIESIEEFADASFEVLVVDNSECARELAALRRALDGRARVIAADRNRGFGAGCNLGAQHARGSYLFLLNPDARLLTPCVRTLVGHLERQPSVGAVGAKLVYGDGQEGHSSGQFIGLRRPLSILKGSLHAHTCHLAGSAPDKSPKRKLAPGVSRVDWCSGAALLMRKADFAELGGFDERYFLYYEECDLQYRMQRALGSITVIDADVAIFHEDGGTGLDNAHKRALIEGGCLRFVRDHRGRAVYAAYKVLMLQVTAAEALLSLARRDLPRARLHAHLLLDIARFRASSRTTTRAAKAAQPFVRPRRGESTWHTETSTAARHAVTTPSSRRAPAS